MKRDNLQRFFVVATFIAGVAAAYLMHRRGEPILGIAKKAIANPVGSLAAEVQNAWSKNNSGGSLTTSTKS